MSRLRTLAVLLPCGALVLAGCAAESGPGPLAVGGDTAMHLCVDPSTSERALGVTYVSNDSERPATLTEVSPVEGRLLREGEAFVVPEGTDAYTVAGSVPPDPDDRESVAAWQARTPAIGADIAPGQTLQVVLPMEFESADSSFTALRVDYEVDGKHFSGVNQTSVRVKQGEADCQ